MIKVTRLKGSEMILNCEMIESVEETPDTVITLTSGKKFVVEEKAAEIIDKVIEFKRKIHTGIPV